MHNDKLAAINRLMSYLILI